MFDNYWYGRNAEFWPIHGVRLHAAARPERTRAVYLMAQQYYAIMCQTDFARARNMAATDQAGIGGRVMRGAERTHGDQRPLGTEKPGYAVDL